MAEKPSKDSKVSAPAAAVTVANGIQLETVKAERRVWMMKCLRRRSPPTAKSWLKSSWPSIHCAPTTTSPPHRCLCVRIYTECFTMELIGTGDRNMPKRYSMDMSTDFVPMAVLSESSQGKPSEEGKIYHQFDMKPHTENIEDYRKLCRERTNKYMTKTRQIRVIDDDSGLRMRPMPGMFDMKSSGSTEKKVQAKGSETKRTRRDPEEMEKIMFRLFESQPNWTLKQLLQKTDQPEQFLKDMLKLLCVYNNKGANQGTYELKPEYRTDEKPDAR